ncbi:FecR family protein [Anditalea andensis]|uniref:Anti-sigma factor n=1 Tax=Anditalea andensis TaxID=1048983 RepID=A0A074KQJ6_9BACT|nr:FecR domain-containing protein [Anditalea andensis]KEO72216.1 anti-sigma factor [Anditalea andensis]
MNQEHEHIETLISKFLVGEATETEISELKEWCALFPENQKYLDDAQLIFEKAQLPGLPEFDSEKAWIRLKSGILPEERKSAPLFPIWKVAAALVLLFGLVYLFLMLQTPVQKFQFISDNQPTTQLMPDSTEITLNTSSEVSVAYNERQKAGTIHLIGEALISIPEQKKVNWTVKAGDLLIEDIGTVFHVAALPESPVVEVSVQEGIVRFYSNRQEGITLHPGERGSYDKASETFSKSTADANVAYFKTKALNFQEEELGSVVAKLEEVFGRSIVMEGEIDTCRISVAFENESLETILTIISETLGLEVIQETDLIRLKGDGCF